MGREDLNEGYYKLNPQSERMSQHGKAKRSSLQKVEMTPTPLTVPDPSKEHQDMLVLPGSRKTTIRKNPKDVLSSASPASQHPGRPLSPEVSEELERLSKIRARTLKFKEDSERVFTFINKGEHLELIQFLESEPEIKVHALYDDRGYTTLHLAAFRNNDKIVAFLLKLVSSKLDSMSEMKAWVNKKTAKEGFTALHFGSFRGNANMIRALIKYQADIRALNFYGLNVMHVAAQGDQPVSLVYFKEKNVPYQVRDKRYSTPLHWACYSGSEIAAAYLLSWDQDVNIKDSEGLTPLHLAVRSAFETNNTRIVKCLLLKGADRSIKDAKGRRPVDFLSQGRDPALTAELRSLLKKPQVCTCYMIRTPLVKMRKSPTTLILFYVQFLISHIFILLYGMPFINSPIWFTFHQILGICLFIALLLLWSRDPGYLQKPKTSFLHLVQKFDPCSLCPDCQVIRTDRSRHCTFCNRCVQRFDHHCPWINNCVGARNHGIFMFFIVLTPLYLLFTIFMVAFSFNNKASCDSHTLPPCIADVEDYNQTAWRVLLIVICLLAGFFIPPTLILFSVQAKNFCMGQTTSERLGRQRSSSSDSSVTSSDSFVDHERRLSSVGPRRRQGPPVASMQNCMSMCCKGEMQDQNQIAEIKSVTESRISSAIVHMAVDRVKKKGAKPEEEHLMGEVFNRSDSFKAISSMKQQ